VGKKTKQKKRASVARRRRKQARNRVRRKLQIALHGSEGGDNEISLFGEPATEGDATRQAYELRRLQPSTVWISVDGDPRSQR
jgi:hypothetical protein